MLRLVPSLLDLLLRGRRDPADMKVSQRWTNQIHVRSLGSVRARPQVDRTTYWVVRTEHCLRLKPANIHSSVWSWFKMTDTLV